MDNKKLIILGAIIIILVFVFSLIIFSNNTPTETIQIQDLNLEQDTFGIYNLKGHITPLKDINYLEARITFYDKQNTILNTGFGWNMNNLKKGDNISVSNGMGAVCQETPDHAVIGFYDNLGGDKPVANYTINFK